MSDTASLEETMNVAPATVAIPGYLAGTWKADPVHSDIAFSVRHGELTLHGVTRPVPLTVEANGFGPDPFGGQRAGFSATAQINRRDHGIDLTVPMDGGGVVVGDKVSISLEIQAVLQT
jgi:polyisoprenoid-binding protein YceI